MTAHAHGIEDPNHTIIIVGDDGKVYRLTQEKWQNDGNVLADPGGEGGVNQLSEVWGYLSFVPPKLAVGIGEVCTVVNLRAILKNNVEPATHKSHVEPAPHKK